MKMRILFDLALRSSRRKADKENMRCLYCGKQLALLRRLTGSGEFCSDAHKKSYHEEYNRLALTRLIAAQSKPDDARVAGSSLNPSTMPLGLADRKGPHALTEGQPNRPSSRWNEVREAAPSRMIPAIPVEAPPPPVAPFIVGRTKPASAPPVENACQVQETIFFSLWAQPNWSPRPDPVDPPQAPPHAKELPTQVPAPAASFLPEPVLAAPVARGFLVGSQVNPNLSYGVRVGLSPRPAIAINLGSLLPKQDSKPRIRRTFEQFRLATMIFGSPDLPAISPGNQVFQKPVLVAAEAPAQPLIPLQVESAMPTPEPGVRSSLQALSVAAEAKVDETTAKAPPKTLAERLTAGGDRPKPQLPSISSLKRPATLAIPSILEPAPAGPKAAGNGLGNGFENGQSRSLWETLRKYIKG